MRGHSLRLIVLASLCACSTDQWYKPRDRVIGEAPNHTPASEYELFVGDARIGTARLWTEGGVTRETHASIHVGLVLIDSSGSGWQVDSTPYLRDIAIGERRIERLEPTRVDGALAVPAGGETSADLWFELEGLTPKDVESFVLSWNITTPDGRTRAELSPFRAADRMWFYEHVSNFQFWTDV